MRISDKKYNNATKIDALYSKLVTISLKEKFNSDSKVLVIARKYLLFMYIIRTLLIASTCNINSRYD